MVRSPKKGKAKRKQENRGSALTGRRRGTVEGVLHVHPDGFGFVHPLSGEENVFLPREEAGRALDQDVVVAQVVPGKGGRTAGKILQVLSRRRAELVGVYGVRGSHAFVTPQDRSIQGQVLVPPTQMARPGDVVKVKLGMGAKLIGRAEGLWGEVSGSLGKPGSPGAEVLSVAFSQGFSDEFPSQVMEEADAYELRVLESEASAPGRRDLRALPLVTIDGADARDFDDAVYAEARGHGFRLVVAIADVSHYVRPGSALDAEALHRATSVYLPDRVLPMLPERLSNGICSLRPDEDRLCMVADLLFSSRAQLQNYELYPGVMKSRARCTYEEVQAVLGGEDVPHRNPLRPQFEQLRKLALALRRTREERGAIDFDLPETRVELDEEGVPRRMVQRDRLLSHRIVEECMLAANEAVAKFFMERKLPSVYRFHGEPDEDKLAAFAAVADAHGFHFDPREVSSLELNALLKKMHGHPEQRALHQLLLRSMMQAVYSAEEMGHYGLAAEHYLHFTSPIRRYPDLLVHRLLKAHWSYRGKKRSHKELDAEQERLSEMALQSSDRERAAMKVERETVAYYASLLMKDRVGELFAGTVSSVTDFGFFVELDQEKVEGLVKAESLGPGHRFDPRLHALVYRSGRRVRVGQKVTVQLISVNLARRQIDFAVESFEQEQVKLPLRPEGRSKKGHRDQGKERPQDRGKATGHPREQRKGEELRRNLGQQDAPSGGSPHPGFDRLRALAAKKGLVRSDISRGRQKDSKPKHRGKPRSSRK